tara:strand:+ start:240 stop:752 length:513 start_codon:yes stop_codon:yes gene_type:complete
MGTKGLLALAFAGTVLAANATLEKFGFVSVGLGLTAPAGVFFAGIAFTLRDLLHESGGRAWVLGAIIVGAMLSWWVDPVFAVASATAFTVSELVDYSIYSPLRKRNWLGAVTVSNVGGLVVDSVLFLWIAFGSLNFIEGQLVGKAYMTLAFVIPLYIYRNRNDLPIWRNQ